MTIKTLTTILLLSTTLLLFAACDSKTTTETIQTQNPTAQPIEETSAEGGDDTATGTGGTSDGSTGTTTNSGETTTTDSNDDNTTTSGGGANEDNTTTTPTVILRSLKLTINKTSLNKDDTTTVKVMATYSDNSTKEVTQEVEWVVTPGNTVKVTQVTLTALYDKDTNIKAKLQNRLSNAIDLNIYWEVNGHTLPPEPNPVENDATLLGVDSNNDGVRDDIERKVYATYPKAIQRAVMMQAFRAKQKMLADPDMVDNARKWEKEITKYIDCGEYLFFYKKQIRMQRKDAELTSEWQFNNKERVEIYIDYNKALSGGVYNMNDPYLQACEFDVKKVMEMDK